MRWFFFIVLMLVSFDAHSAVLTSYEAGQDAGCEIGCGGGGCATRERACAQSFILANDATITDVDLYLNRNTGQGGIDIRIETEGSGTPSGTLADANAVCTIDHSSTPTSFAFANCTFSTSFELTASTTYWLHARRTVKEAGGADQNYGWGTDSSSPTYTDGEFKQSDNDYSTGPNWYSVGDALFRINGEEASGFTPKTTWFN